MGPPETPSRVVQPSPNMFPSLQFSPDLFSQSPFAPVTAPVYPQQRLFWDPSMAGMDPNAMAPYQDPYVLPHDFSDSFASTSTIMPSFQPSPQLPSQPEYSFPTVSRPMSTSFIDGAAFPAPFHTSPRMPPLRDDNPSMFLSSPARRFGNPDPHPLVPSNAIREKPAYYHQIEESRREKEAKRAKKSEVRHPSVTRSVMEALRRPISPVKELRPGLKRSLTHSGIGGRQPHLRQPSHVSFLDNASQNSGSTSRSRTGRTSPLKSLAEGMNRSSSSRNSKRTSVSLAIDENGVAKTVITKVPEDDNMDLDDDESSDSAMSLRDETDFTALRSHQNSFAFVDDEEIDPPYNPRHSLQSHSKNSSRSTMASSHSLWHSSRTSSTTSAMRNTITKRNSMQRKQIRTDTHHSLLEANPGDAQQALRAIIQDRSRSTSANDDSVGSHHSLQFNSSPPIVQSQFSVFNASPTTITDPDLATPSTDRESSTSNGSTRCVCNSTNIDPNVVMIQW
jgi:hypothetical protein